MSKAAEASREIMWNVSHPMNSIVMYAMFALSVVLLGWAVYRRIKLWLAGKSDDSRFNNWPDRFNHLLHEAMGQRSVNRDRAARFFHSCIFLGFLVLTFTTTMVLIDHDLNIRIYRGWFYLVVTVMSDAFGVILLLGLAVAARRRLIDKPDRVHVDRNDFVILWLLALLVVQGYLLEALRIHATNDPWGHYSFVGLIVSKLFWALSEPATRWIHFAMWWFHAITFFAGLAYLPYTKLFHIISSSANLFFSDLKRQKGALRSPGNVEQILEESMSSDTGEFSFGVGTFEDLTWKQRLDLDACTSCGRCQEVCPAYNSGKPLSPKWLILDARNHMLALSATNAIPATTSTNALDRMDTLMLSNFVGNTNAMLSPRSSNELVNSAALNIGGEVGARLAGEVMDEEVFWSCTTCRACMEVCPVAIEHVDLIVDVRRNLALVQGSMPHEAQSSLRAIEARGNPFGDPDARTDWASGLDVKVLKPGDEVDVLYWVGCISAYDKRKQGIARAVAKILNAAGVSWGILGNQECCTGDPARRLGDENLFQTLAKKNLTTLSGVKFNKIIANCPHCFNSIKNEYSEVAYDPALKDVVQYGDERVIHHSVFIQQLINDGKITVSHTMNESVTYHDPCYLGRYNDHYDEPRDVLIKIGGHRPREMSANREKGLCCGAGGGHFWMDRKIGERVNVQRVNQAAETEAKIVATACPFCLHMMEDGTKITDRDGSMAVKDIAELVAESIV
jgi:Fe-S oxidoreductase/nitrate reductase gamma subunit